MRGSNRMRRPTRMKEDNQDVWRTTRMRGSNRMRRLTRMKEDNQDEGVNQDK